jgi:hypothetical protein
MGATIVRIYAMHEPLKAFFYFSLPFFLIGGFFVARFFFFYFTEKNLGNRFIQSVILGGVSLMLGVVLMLIGLLADLISRNRRLVEDSLFRVKKMELEMMKQKDREETLLDELRALRSDLKLTVPTEVRPLTHHNGHHLKVTEVEEIPVEEINLSEPPHVSVGTRETKRDG